MSDITLTLNAPQYWERLYEAGLDEWDLGKATPALLEFFKHASCPKSGDVLVTAAGRGWDAQAFAKRGHDVLAVDFCSSALDSITALANNNRNLLPLNLDIFSLTPDYEKRGGKQFDIIYDYCCFNSIHTGRRDECIEMWHRMLKDDGLLIGFFFPLGDEAHGQHPPFSISKSELEARFCGIMEIKEKIMPAKSVEARAGREEIWLMKKI